MTENLEDVFASYRRALRAEGRSGHTIRAYQQAIVQFADWLTGHGRPANLAELTKDNLRSWFAELSESKEPGTVATRFRSMRAFCRWLEREEIIDWSPMAGMQQPTVPDRPVPVLTDEQLRKLIKVCEGRGFYERRDEALIRTLIETGVRVGELVAMGFDDLDLDAGAIMVRRGKGGKARFVYFGARTARALDRYLRLRRQHPQAAYTDRLWLTQFGPLTEEGARDVVERRGRQAGIDGLHPHVLRHCFAHRWLASGGQERDLMRLAGWASDTMLSRYGASAADERAREAAKRLALGDRL